jgi:putative mRNA 3-end processing factor
LSNRIASNATACSYLITPLGNPTRHLYNRRGRMNSKKTNVAARTFVFRGGTRIAGTVIACDAWRGDDLSFVSSARPRPGQPSPIDRSSTRPARGQILTTETTLALLGPRAARLRSRALVLGYGRPFVLGSLRIELLPSGILPGAASLACEGGERRILYAAAARLGAPATGAEAGAVRAAHALCLDATFGHPRFAFVPLAEAQGAACAFAQSARAAGCAPVLLTAPFGPAHDVVPALAAAGWRLRGHRSTVAATAAFRAAGVQGPPVARFSGTLAEDEVLLWPADARGAGLLARLGRARLAWLSGWAADAEATERLGVDQAIPYSNLSDHAGLLAYAAATGAREIATVDGFAQDLANALRERGVADAYALGPPRQIALFD